MKRSNKFYAILAIPLSIRRDNQILELIDGNPIYMKKYVSTIRGTLLFYDDNFTQFVKTWNTKQGAQDYIDKILYKIRLANFSAGMYYEVSDVTETYCKFHKYE